MQNRRKTRSFLPFLGLALLVHNVLIFGGVIYYLVRGTEIAQEEPVDVGVVANDDEAARRLADDIENGLVDLPPLSSKPAEPAPPPPEQKPPEEEPLRAPGQVVDIQKPAVEKAPNKSRFVAEHDSSVEKETKSRYGDPTKAPGRKAPEQQAQTPTPQQPPPGPLAMRTPGEERRAPGTHAGKGVMPEQGEHSPDSPAEKSPDGVLPEKAQTQSKGGAPGSTKAAPNVPNLIPSDKQLMRSIAGGGGGTNDYLKDIDEGEDTALNAKKWKFASFFNRVKRSVAEHWRPDVEYRRRDPSGNVYGMRDRITVLRVQLKPDGSLANVIVEQPCGVDFLDDEAIAAFKAAQPFPNPPRQLVDESGMIQFKFAFIFEISGSPAFKIFRYN
jgi:TonB family protein